MIKVLFIPSWYPYKGMPHAGSFFIDQAEALAKYKVAEITLLNWGQNEYQLVLRHPVQSMQKLVYYAKAYRDHKQLNTNLNELHIPHLSWTSLISKGNIDALIDKIELPDKPDIIHAHVTFPAGYLAYKLSIKLGIPYIITEHSGPFPFPEFMGRNGLSPLISAPLNAANKVLTVSSFLQHEILSKTGIHVDVIPNMVNTDYYQPPKQPLINKQFRLFALSSLTEAKGAWDLLEAVKMLRDKGMEFKLFWGGAGSLKHKLMQYVRMHNLRACVTFLGQINPSEALYQYHHCDCFVMPSRIESFSMVLIEAMACGKPVVATDCGGPRDIVNDLSGLLVAVGKPKELAAGIVKMNEQYLTYSPDIIRNHCITNYNPLSVSKQIEQVYKSVLV
ncbi:MAG: glycosyltransferase [Candidatus Cloacimonetes bacterium]|nr:glycosyltransferase [Candidatus Cloacimonadota bacterium]MDD3236046.1 glycosyltransferase [Candidatus Cloacimonadota bacterium]